MLSKPAPRWSQADRGLPGIMTIPGLAGATFLASRRTTEFVVHQRQSSQDLATIQLGAWGNPPNRVQYTERSLMNLLDPKRSWPALRRLGIAGLALIMAAVCAISFGGRAEAAALSQPKPNLDRVTQAIPGDLVEVRRRGRGFRGMRGFRGRAFRGRGFRGRRFGGRRFHGPRIRAFRHRRFRHRGYRPRLRFYYGAPFVYGAYRAYSPYRCYKRCRYRGYSKRYCRRRCDYY